jgi:hypothetical protein
MNKKIFITAILSSLVTFNSCNSPTETDQQFKHPREMTWSADTLMPDPEAIQLLPENILAFSPKDIWLVCYSDVARRLLWHYDGIEWKPVESGGGKRYTDLAGYNSEDIWLGGYNGEKVHFTHKVGNTFTRHDFNIAGQIKDMTIDPQGNIWACGRNGIIMKYDKSKWIVDTLKMNFNSETAYYLNTISYFNNRVNLLLTTIDIKSLIQTYYFVYGSIGKWTIADSMKFIFPNEVKWGNLGLFSINNSFYSYGLQGIWININDEWIKKNNFDGEIYDMFGVSENYIFATSAFNNVIFYDGSYWDNIKDLFRLNDPYAIFRNGWTNGKETFIIVDTISDRKQKVIVFHGK